MEIQALMSTAEAARYLGVSRQRVYALRANGRLAGVHKAGRWFYLRTTVSKMAQELRETRELQEERIQRNLERIEAKLNGQRVIDL